MYYTPAWYGSSCPNHWQWEPVKIIYPDSRRGTSPDYDHGLFSGFIRSSQGLFSFLLPLAIFGPIEEVHENTSKGQRNLTLLMAAYEFSVASMVSLYEVLIHQFLERVLTPPHFNMPLRHSAEFWNCRLSCTFSFATFSHHPTAWLSWATFWGSKLDPGHPAWYMIVAVESGLHIPILLLQFSCLVSRIERGIGRFKSTGKQFERLSL